MCICRNTSTLFCVCFHFAVEAALYKVHICPDDMLMNGAVINDDDNDDDDYMKSICM